jgi:hypothetical protein
MHAETPASGSRFAVRDLEEEAPPRSFMEAGERGDTNFIVKAIERTLDFKINQAVRAHGVGRAARLARRTSDESLALRVSCTHTRAHATARRTATGAPRCTGQRRATTWRRRARCSTLA